MRLCLRAGLLAEARERAVREFVAPEEVETLDLLLGAALGWRDLLPVALHHGAEGCALEEPGIRCRTTTIDPRFQITRAALSLALGFRALRPRLHTQATHLGLPTASQLPDRCQCRILMHLVEVRRTQAHPVQRQSSMR